METNEIQAGLAEILRDVTGAESAQLTATTTLQDLEIDSLAIVEILVETEDRFGIRVADDDIQGLKTVGDLLAYIEKARDKP